MKKIVKWLDENLELLLLSIAIAVIVIVMTAQVISRKIIGRSITFTEPLCCHLLMCICLFGVPCSIRLGNAIRFDVILTFVSDKIKLIFGVISDLTVAAFFLYLTPSAFSVAQSLAQTDAITLPYKLGLVYTVCAIAILLTVLRSIQHIFISCKTIKQKPQAKDGDVGGEIECQK